MKSNLLFIESHQDQGLPEKHLHSGQGGATHGFKNHEKWTTDSYPLKLVRKEPTETYGKFYLKEGESNMSTLKRRFKDKLEQAKRLREKVGDPVALGRSIIEISEEEADRKLSNFKGYKYVSKKP